MIEYIKKNSSEIDLVDVDVSDFPKCFSSINESHVDSVNQFVASAAAEKLTALLTEEYLNKRAHRASRKKFLAVLDKVPDVEPEDYDKL